MHSHFLISESRQVKIPKLPASNYNPLVSFWLILYPWNYYEFKDWKTYFPWNSRYHWGNYYSEPNATRNSKETTNMQCPNLLIIIEVDAEARINDFGDIVNLDFGDEIGPQKSSEMFLQHTSWTNILMALEHTIQSQIRLPCCLLQTKECQESFPYKKKWWTNLFLWHWF